ncbi:MAG: hypothetical protein AB7O55_04885 [Lautropia sp.]
MFVAVVPVAIVSWMIGFIAISPVSR